MRGGGKRIRAILVATLKNDPPPRQSSASGGGGYRSRRESTTPRHRLIKGGNPFVPVELALNIRPEFLYFEGDRISP